MPTSAAPASCGPTCSRPSRRSVTIGPMSVTFAEKLARMPGYQAGVPTGHAPEAIASAGIAQLASNESPQPPHPKVVEAIASAAAAMNRYPDPDATLLRRRLAERYETEPSRIAVGNGSCEILLAAAEALCEPGAEIVYAWPAFSMYPYLPALTGAREVRVPLAEGDVHDLDAMAAEVTAATQLLGDFPNLVVLRTFSKCYGLAGLRVGYALGSPKFRAAVDAVRQPFSVNALAQAAGAEAILHQDDALRRVETTIAARLTVEEALAGLGLRTADTHANFSWIDLGDADEAAVIAGLAEREIAVRPGKALGGPGHIRVSYGTAAENERFLRGLSELLD